MVAKYFVFFALIKLSLQENWTCPTPPLQPQLSATYLDGYWYELLSMNNYLNHDLCSHFKFTCTDSSSCEILHVKWESYALVQIYNGSIKQKDDGVVLIISDDSASKSLSEKQANINIKFGDETVLIWKCNATYPSDSFASLFVRLEEDEDMQDIWYDIERHNEFPYILENFPAGIWKKANTTGCISAASRSINFINSLIVACMTIITFCINM